MSVTGLLLAAGAGRRMGMPKSLLHDTDGTSWLRRSTDVLREGGCSAVNVVLGAEAGRASRLLENVRDIRIVIASDWAKGMGASLAAGLTALHEDDASCVLGLIGLPGTRPSRRPGRRRGLRAASEHLPLDLLGGSRRADGLPGSH